MTARGVTGIILAGGDSLRYAGGAEPKALAPVAGAPLVLQVAACMVCGGAARILVLTGRNHALICRGLGVGPGADCTESVRSDLSIRWTDGSGITVPLELRPSGESAGTGGRLLSIERAEIGSAALLGYTDVLTDAPLPRLLDHCGQGAELALLAVQPQLPWGVLRLGQDDGLLGFDEKPRDTGRWINGGMMAITPALLDRISGRDDVLETDVIAQLLADPRGGGRVRVTRHEGYWAAVETRKDMLAANAGIEAGAAPWKRWTELSLLCAASSFRPRRAIGGHDA